MPKRYQLCAKAEPSTTIFENEVLSLRTDRAGLLSFSTDWTVHTWLDDDTSGSQLFVIVHPTTAWPAQQNCNIQNLVIRERLRVLELQLKDQRAYVITTNDELKEVKDD